MARFTVDRRTWLRGVGDESKLLRDGCRCCFGFVAQQCGVDDSQTDSVAYLRHLDGASARKKVSEFFNGFGKELTWLGTAYAINDAEDIEDSKRESQLQKLFAANGHELVFEN